MRPEKAQEHVGAHGYPVAAESLPPRPLFKLTKAMALKAVTTACAPYSAYIHDEVRKMHRVHVRDGGTGFCPKTGLLLARLNSLAADGMLIRSGFPDGYYGYHWTITAEGREAVPA